MFIDTHTHYISLRYNRAYLKSILDEYKKYGKFRDGDVDERRYKWLEKILGDVEKALAEEIPLHDMMFDMKSAGVDKAIIVSTELTMNRLVLRAVQKHPDKLYGAFYLDPFNIEETLSQLQQVLHEEKKIVAVKALLQYYRISPISQGLFPVYNLCSRVGLPVQFHVGIGDDFSKPKDYELLSQEFPNLKIVCLHAGGARYEEFGELARKYDNIYLESEGLQLPEIYDCNPEVLFELINTCGSHKIMFGSDWIWQEEKYFYRVKTIKRLPAKDGENISYKTATTVYKIT
jgi:predicted TIM-barrel fold metal-dependent hydrolase